TATATPTPTATSTPIPTPTATPDTVTITLAEYTQSDGQLRVEATSTSPSATLTAYVTSTNALIGTLTNNGGGNYRIETNWPSNPQQILVRSNRGGSATSAVTLN